MRDDFACFILCHGRPNSVKTYKSLRKRNYTGPIYIICDDGDPTLEEYKFIFGEDNVLVFNKLEILKQFDTMDTSDNRACAVYARNACFDFAKKLGIKYFCELDDDYSDFWIRPVIDNRAPCIAVPNLDEIFSIYVEFLNTNPNLYSVAFAQPGDYIGGAGCQLVKNGYKRKCMNSWICDVDKYFVFNGRMNDDVNTYSLEGSRGKVFITLPTVAIDQPVTQVVKGGMTDMYVGEGTYVKSFYTVMCCPSFVKISVMGRDDLRIHHNVDWNAAAPKIISGAHRKE